MSRGFIGLFIDLVRLGAALLACAGGMAQAQGAGDLLPERRPVVIHSSDFPGNDLAQIFDSSLSACQATCISDPSCKAFTYNLRAAACFPKSAAAEPVPYVDAVSAWIFESSPKVRRRAARRAQDLGIVPQPILAEAADFGRQIGSILAPERRALDELMTEARRHDAAGALTRSIAEWGGAAAMSDDPLPWLRLSNALLRRLQGSTRLSAEVKERSQRWGTAAAIGAYVRARSVQEQTDALLALAKGLELRGLGRKSIEVLELAAAIDNTPTVAAELDRADLLYGFQVAEHKVETTAAQPRICVSFSEPLAGDGVEYADFVRVDAPQVAVTARGRDLCIDGIDNGRRYKVTLRRGLPGKSGRALRKPVTLDVYVRDRDPMVSFTGRGYILPRGADAAIPIVTVNTDRVDLKLFRVDERSLVRVQREGLLGNALAVYEEDRLRESLGQEIWSGEGRVRIDLNREVTTRLPLGDVLTAQKPGVYALRARLPGENPWDATAPTQWFVISDIGLVTMKGADGLHVFARSFQDAGPRVGVTVRLVAVDNSVLAETATDMQGHAHFAPGLLRGKSGAAPALVTAEDGDDFAFLSLTEAAFDLSDRGVEGNPVPGPVDVFVTTDRGAYRPGEEVHAVALVRDASARALEGLPLTAIIRRPDGVEFARALLPDLGAGGRIHTLALGQGAQRGTWKIALHTDPDAAPVAETSFLVEDFVPERIDFDVTLPPAPIDLTTGPEIEVSARYLYGAPGAGLPVRGLVRLAAARNLPDWPGFAFGLEDDGFSARTQPLDEGISTEQDGVALLQIPSFELPQSTRPLELTAVVRIAEGSNRPVERRASAPVLSGAPLIGIHPQFDGDLPEGATAGFELIALDPQGARTAMKVKWTLNRLRTRYQWYRAYDRWNWEPIVTRERVAVGEAELTPQALAGIEARVDWGRYELRVDSTDDPAVAASVSFYAGWYVPADTTSTPDTLDVSLDARRYRIGDTARLRIVPRHAGTALVTVVSERLVAMRSVEVAEGENIVTLPVTEDWGTGVYVTASVIRPMSLTDGRSPARALGLSWAGVAPGDRLLKADLEAPEEAAPRRTMDVALRVDGVAPGETAYATIAAVDVGVLNITGFQPPDPVGHYFDQRRLGVEIRDLYGRLIDISRAETGALRQGGDALAAARLNAPPPSEQVLALFQGPLRVGPDGVVRTAFEIPDFNGTVRLMAVVWSRSGVGQATRDVLVRDPVVVTASLPRFLAPGDRSRLLIELAHVSGPAGRVGVEILAEGSLELDTGEVPPALELAQGGRATLAVPIRALGVDDARIRILTTTPDGKRLDKDLTLGIRDNAPVIARTTQLRLRPGQTLTLDANVLAGLRPGTASATISAGPIARLDAPGLLRTLDRYPYGCTEQLTSRAMPLLYFSDVARAMGLTHGRDIDQRIAQAITEILANQGASGGFGLWRPGQGDLWLEAYVTDFLSRARGQGHPVPDLAFSLALDNLANRVNYYPEFERGGEDLAYALMVLAREGRAAIGDLRYHADASAGRFATPLALAQLGAALAYYGDQARADALFRKADQELRKRFAVKLPARWRPDFGTPRRDAAAVLALAVEAGSEAVDRNRWSAQLAPATDRRYVSTQEAAWTLLAANALIEASDEGDFTLDGKPVTGPLVRVLDSDLAPARKMRLQNNARHAQYVSVTAYGVPDQPEPAGGNGYAIDRQIYTLDGDPVDPGEIAVNDRLVVVLTVTPLGRREARLMVNDPLPAGLEIDNPHLIAQGEVAQLDWIGETARASHAEFRSDRFLAAVDWRSDAPFRLAYVVRAISPGNFAQPAASVEDMYRPAMRARSEPGRVVIR